MTGEIKTDQETNGTHRDRVPVSQRGNSVELGVHLFERLKNGPRGAVLDLAAVGPLAVYNAVKGVIEANARLARLGQHLSIVPSTQRVERTEGQYTETIATVLVLVLKDMN